MIAYLTYRSLWISQVHQQIVTFQIKMDNIFQVQVFHSEGSIHSNNEFLSTIKRPITFFGHKGEEKKGLRKSFCKIPYHKFEQRIEKSSLLLFLHQDVS